MKIERIIHSVVVLVMALLSPFAIHLSPLSAQTSMLSIGVRGGGHTYLPTAAVGAAGDVQPSIGVTGSLDLRYSLYGCLANRLGIGLTVGAGVGYGEAGIKGTNTDQYTNSDYLGNTIDYTIHSAFIQKDRFTKVDLSLLLALYLGNFTVNIGPRWMMPFVSSSSFTIQSADIDAYYPLYDVHVTNQLITGKLETPYTQSVTPTLPQQNILMAMELGYEWYLNEITCLGLQAFADIAVWNRQSTNPLTTNPLIQVAPITDVSNPVPAVTVNPAANLTVSKRYLDFGVRIYYAFSFSSTRETRRKIPRDTRLHHNRILY